MLTYCLAKPGAWLDSPWDESFVVKVGPKILAFLGAADGESVGLKCATTPEEANEVGTAWTWGGGSPDGDLSEAIDVSYAWMVSRLVKRGRPN